MNNIGKCAIAGIAALAAGAGAYLTMPAGRALTEQEKRETWGNEPESGSGSCYKCKLTGKTCIPAGSTAENVVCFQANLDRKICNGQASRTPVSSRLSDVARSGIDELCPIIRVRCLPVSPTRPDALSWLKVSQEQGTMCGRIDTCDAEATSSECEGVEETE